MAQVASPQGKEDPKWGFYSMVPRIVRKEYTDLKHTEKWLYSCLRDLCGPKGTCFRTLRSLKEETGISIASLSTMIPRLHEAGLIHGERKSRGRGGKEVWHITITDIWQANQEYCSKNEQLSEDVQKMNNTSYVVVQIPNNYTGYVKIEDGVVQNLKLVVQILGTEEGISEEGKDTYVPPTESQEKHICDCANAPSHLRLVGTDLDLFSEDTPEAQPLSYSQQPQQVTQNTLFEGADGYMKQPEQPTEAQQDTSSKPKKPRKTQPKVELTPEQLEQCRRWYAHFVKVRGEPFETKGDKINAGKYIKKLVLKYDETTIMRIYKHLSEKDFKWSKPSFKFKITPYVVYTEAPSVLQQLSDPEQAKPKSELLNMTDWTDEEYDHWRRTNETPIRTRRIQA